ncbi:hypothetical protein M569_08670 [Genlisea aurea]|uniref:Uncharacterized protein n=1 Tax=Genlisea aurea TaxID=192259 RepID=S8E1C8_9LAMI|nr:hypothetical protein M569_08670 [Genlisea aurea]
MWFIFCRGVLALFSDDDEERVPVCLPELPGVLSVHSQAVKSAVGQLAACIGVTDCFTGVP